MKAKFILLIPALFFVLNVNAQVQFEKGYYITNQNDTITCLIKNKGWTNTPNSFSIKNIETNEKRELSIDELKLIRISNGVKFINTIVHEDVSDNNAEGIANDKIINFTERGRLLQVLIESEYSLYVAENGNEKKFFYSGSDEKIWQLINKRFYIDGGNIGSSQEYLKQLLRINVCESAELNNRAINSNLNESNLIYYFEQINSCLDADIVKFEEKDLDAESQIRYSLKLGLNISSSQYLFRSPNSAKTIEFPSNLSYSLGVEVEIPIKANRFKWSLIFEPTFKYLASSTTVIDQSLDRNYEYQIYSLDIPLGVRYKFYLSDNLTMFLNFKPQFTLNLGSSYVDLDFAQYHNAETKFNLNAGLGFKWKNMILEYRRDPQDVLYQRVYEKLIIYNNIFIIGYTFL